MTHIGEIAALTTAVCWSFTSLSFETVSRRIGSLSLNLIRLFIVSLIFIIYTFIRTGYPFPTGLTHEQWIWLALSGAVGFFLGDMAFFKAFQLIGARMSMALYSTVPVFSAVLGFIFLGERMSILHLLGMFISIAGVMVVIVSHEPEAGVLKDKMKLGVLMAFLGTLGQAAGLLLSKKGMADDPFMATQVRALAAMVLFGITFTMLRRWGMVAAGIRDRRAMAFAGLGSFFGPFLGVSLSLLAIQYTTMGITSTLTGLAPILVIPLSVLLKKEKVNFREILGTFIAIGGASILFIK